MDVLRQRGFRPRLTRTSGYGGSAMIVDYAPATGLLLLEADDFKRFKLRLSGSAASPKIDGVVFLDENNALIGVHLPPTLLGTQATPEWRAGYQAMIDYATQNGWI